MFNRILNHINNQNYSLLYIGVGTAMPDYSMCDNKENHTVITPQNFQQHPLFINRFSGNKIILLIDPRLESPLHILEYYANMGRQIVLSLSINSILSIYTEVNGETSDMIIAVKDSIYWSDQREESYSEHFAFLVNIIMSCMDNNIKVIMQDYSGIDITNTYSRLINIFGKEILFPNVIFDVTYGDGNCMQHIDVDTLKLDKNGNFVQEKFLLLSRLAKINSSNFKRIREERVNLILSELSYKYHRKVGYMGYDIEKINPMFTIYRIEEKHDLTDIERVTQNMLQDISISSHHDMSGMEMFSYITNRSKFIDIMTKITMEPNNI
jgi:hypothetical protein